MHTSVKYKIDIWISLIKYFVTLSKKNIQYKNIKTIVPAKNICRKSFLN